MREIVRAGNAVNGPAQVLNRLLALGHHRIETRIGNAMHDRAIREMLLGLPQMHLDHLPPEQAIGLEQKPRIHWQISHLGKPERGNRSAFVQKNRQHLAHAHPAKRHRIAHLQARHPVELDVEAIPARGARIPIRKPQRADHQNNDGKKDDRAQKNFSLAIAHYPNLP